MKTINIRRVATILMLALLTIPICGTSVERMPQFPGGEDALKRFLEENTHCPQEMIRDSVSGRFIVSFLIEKDGSTTDFKIVKRLLKDK
ncbi:MAG: hypothetical protein IKI47_00485, partial [Prevotella sp.]|nr:hypothetical protein [Prevotella sp.]